MFFFCFLNSVSSLIHYDYLYSWRSGIKFNCQNVFSNYNRADPGIKLNFDKNRGGVSQKKVVTFHSQAEVKQFLQKNLNSEEFEKISKRLMLKKYATAVNTMFSKEVYKNGIYSGRYFEINTKFFSYEKLDDNLYKVTIAPFIVSLHANTFVYGCAASRELYPKEVEFDISKINDKKYLFNIFSNKAERGYLIVNAPYQVLLKSHLTVIIFDRLYSQTLPEREKFLKSLQ